ncbi:MAG: acyl-ACP--UDP-N-acetylglucosamine O-acyltransferase [Caulobacterales bacterium]|nr:acyl-ACP--UDP-N-acetylglucosamine O-acyltransferase [Caulobacterales bacterium]
MTASPQIHPTAIVDPRAELYDGVEVGPYCVIDGPATLRERVRLMSHVCMSGRVDLGADSVVHPFSVLGHPPQDSKYQGEDTRLVIGPRSVLREQVTMHLGTLAEEGETIVGSDGYFMVGSHVAHDCTVGDHVVFANNATLGGAAVIGDHVIIGGLAAVHQHPRVGRHAFIGGLAAVVKDVIPYGSVYGNHATLSGLNLVGLKRRDFAREVIQDLRVTYRLLAADEGTLQERVDGVAHMFPNRAEVQEIIAFIRAPAKRPLCLPD